jgi:hypothetical protein
MIILGIISEFQMWILGALYFLSIAAVLYYQSKAKEGILNLSTFVWVVLSVIIPFLVPIIYFLSRIKLERT